MPLDPLRGAVHAPVHAWRACAPVVETLSALPCRAEAKQIAEHLSGKHLPGTDAHTQHNTQDNTQDNTTFCYDTQDNKSLQGEEPSTPRRHTHALCEA